MPLAFKPHLADVEKVEAVMSGQRILRYDMISAGSVAGQLTEKTPEEIRDGFGLETKLPALWLMDLDGGVELAAGDRLTVNGRVYRVVASPRVSDAEVRSSHQSVVCERDA